MPHRTVCALLVGALALVWPLVARSAVPQTTPSPGLRENAPAVHALVGARIVVAPGKVIERGNLIIRDGVITAVGEKAVVPSHARVWQLDGKTLYAGFIDSGGEVASSTSSPQPLPGPGYWSDHVAPQRRAELVYQADKKLNEKLRSQGITARLIAPSAGIIHGTSAVVATGEAAAGQSLLASRVALHLKLSTSRKLHSGGYPNSPMGALALGRQAFYDARWHTLASEAYRQKPGLPRPERNIALEALSPYARGSQRVVVEAADNLYFLRADRFAKEFGLKVVVRGSGEEYQLLDAIKDTGAAVVVPVSFPKPPDVVVAEKAADVSLARLMHWDLAPENPGRLAKAGVTIALCTHGLKDAGTFLSAVRRAVSRGLSPDAALAALTTEPARLWGVDGRLGTLEAGKAAHVVVADGDLFVGKSKVLETWVDGRRHETATRPAADLRGTWEVTLKKPDGGSESIRLKLGGEPTALTGTAHRGKTETKLTHVALSGAQCSAAFAGKPLGWSGVVQLSATLIPDANPDESPALLGGVVWPEGQRSSLSGKRVAAFDPREDAKQKAAPAKDGAAQAKDGQDKKPTEKSEPPKKALFAVNYPFGDFGRAAVPAQPKVVLFRDATVWTCGPQGTLEAADVLVESGKIRAVGKKLEIPTGATVVDAHGLHITPGLIDCHSHIATDGGVNETGQTITAEVRVGDFVDHQDINIYRQLAGGVTAINILHGSANAIGGQNQVIKMRWGMLPEQLKFAAAMPGIKFALGENVKQSNWGDSFRTRYPQTRMGVEQLIRDAFQAAIEYRRGWNNWRRFHTGLPPRTDLELEALSEVLAGTRLVHCHAYRQDEMLALMKTCEDYGVRIATFQHVLEGYKVADAMARHGVGGSSFADWWAYKFEVLDAIPFNGALMHNAGVLVSFNSDDAELGRRLNLEAAKAVKYGGVPAAEALKFVTLNPARQLRVDAHAGSLEAGKDADLVVWNGPPLSSFSRVERTWIDGREFFNRADDLRAREELARMRAALIQRALAVTEPAGEDEQPKDQWPREDIFCLHDEDH